MKRFTETTKWSKPWFRKLEPKFKAFWLYLVDSCDVAGVWDADLELAAFHVGSEFTLEEINDVFKGRIEILPNGKWFITTFIAFQYGELNPENNCHKAVLRSLEANQIQGPDKALSRPSEGPQDKDKDKDKVRKGKRECEGETVPDILRTPEFLAAWERWKRHRREIRKPLTQTAAEANLVDLAKYGPVRAVEVIDFTIRKTWQGLADEAVVPRRVSATSPAPLRQAPPKAADAKELFE